MLARTQQWGPEGQEEDRRWLSREKGMGRREREIRNENSTQRGYDGQKIKAWARNGKRTRG